MGDLRKRILVLEDDPEIRSLLVAVLEPEGFEVKTAGTIMQFQAMSRSDTFDLFILDLGLPDGSGLSLLQPLREETNAGIILLTARQEEIDQVVGLELGADDYIGKPFRRRELIARIHAVMRRSAAKAAPPNAHQGNLPADHEFDGYRVWLTGRRVLAPDGSDVPLTRAEFDILSVFLKRRGRTLTRDQLMQTVKGRDWEIHDRAVDTLVSKLRRKLPPPEGRTIPYIRTIHGLGYGFMD